MLKFFVKRFGYLLLTMLAVSLIIFTINEYSPGQVARKILGPYAPENSVQILTVQMGLDRPLLVRYVDWLGHILRGDLGKSTLWGADVSSIIWDRLLNTSIIASIAFAIIVPASIIFGVAAGMRESSGWIAPYRSPASSPPRCPNSPPASSSQSIFVIWLGLLPGTSPLDPSGGWSIASQLVLPVAVMVLYDLGYVVRMVRASMVETMTRPFIRTAVLKGLSFRKVILKHAIRNAMIGPFTVILLQVNYLLTGVVVVEAVFGFPGFGRMMLDAALNKDIAVIEAGSMFAVFVTVATQIVGDFGYMLLNPRIRFA